VAAWAEALKETMTVYAKLNEARLRFHSTAIKKTGKNKFQGYEFFEMSDFLVPALKIFADLKLCAVVSFNDALASMTVTDTEDGSQFVITSPMSTAELKACHPVQNLGAVQSYLRRYLWTALLEIVEHDAIDSGPGAEPRQAIDLEDPRRLEWIDAQILKFAGCSDVAGLKFAFDAASAYASGKGDEDALAQLKAAASARKSEITKK
jgi:hypothetical protein